MEFIVKQGQPGKHRADCLVVGIYENRKLTPSAEALDVLSDGYLQSLLKQGDLDGKCGQSLLLYRVPGLSSERVLLVGIGPKKDLSEKEFKDLIRLIICQTGQKAIKQLMIYLDECSVPNRDHYWKTRTTVELFAEAHYRFDEFKTQKTKSTLVPQVVFGLQDKRHSQQCQQAILHGKAIALGINLTKNLANQPPNICTPTYLAKEAKQLAADYARLSFAQLDEKQMTALKMGALLSVAQGSKNPPKLITLEYRGGTQKQKPIVFVGKGITFDTGGNSLKSPASMIGMKYDMCGGATVLGVLKAVAELELPLNVIGVVPAAENMPGNEASRPEDIVTTMSGLTVEILNTDAEGRLVLCDALTYCERFNPDVVIDIATLTGACVVTLGHHVSGLMSNHEPLTKDLYEAGLLSGDRCWEFPLWEPYHEALNSAFADIANIGVPSEAGTILGGCFLSKFTKNYHWAHLDIAGVATKGGNGKDRGATGRPVGLLMQYLLNRV